MLRALLVSGLALVLAACSAETPLSGSAWQLNAESSGITFVSIKNGDVAEVSRFERLSGAITNARTRR